MDALRERIDSTTATGRCFLSMMGAIHQMEREDRR
jgi:DNA invertase Pin-like site-specific DNA recombinase